MTAAALDRDKLGKLLGPIGSRHDPETLQAAVAGTRSS
jgi:hypothetical protein